MGWLLRETKAGGCSSACRSVHCCKGGRSRVSRVFLHLEEKAECCPLARKNHAGHCAKREVKHECRDVSRQTPYSGNGTIGPDGRIAVWSLTLNLL